MRDTIIRILNFIIKCATRHLNIRNHMTFFKFISEKIIESPSLEFESKSKKYTPKVKITPKVTVSTHDKNPRGIHNPTKKKIRKKIH
jgi:hypothetical protein